MPKFDDYTQKTTPEDNDIALILDKTANVNKKTPFSGIWTWIVNKMTNAVIQNLQTTNKTVIGSINELNSKMIKVGVLVTGDNLGAWLANNLILSGEKMCVLALNGAQNNPLGQCYAIIIHSVGYWSKHPQYIKLSGNTITTGVLDCTDTANIKIQGQ